MDITLAYSNFFVGVLLVLAALIMCCFIRAIRGPTVSDRVLAINMIGTVTIVIIAILSVILEEEYLLDICLIYAMISFIAVVVISKVFLGAFEEKRQKLHDKEQEDEE